jgi:hypothetical protein
MTPVVAIPTIHHEPITNLLTQMIRNSPRAAAQRAKINMVNESMSYARSRAMGLVDSAGLAAALSYVETSGDPISVARNYGDLVRALYDVRKDVSQMLVAARAGIRHCLEAAERLGSDDPASAAVLKENAKTIAFNAAANSWPGWGDDGIVIDQHHLVEAMDLASLSLRLVEDLQLGNKPLGTARWLVGAIHLAAGRLDEATAAFARARDAYRADGRRVSELLAEGYRALARKRGPHSRDAVSEFDDIARQLEQDGSPAALAFLRQLVTADRLL